MSAVLPSSQAAGLNAATPATTPRVGITPTVKLTPADRLAASRGRLRDTMMSISHPPARPASAGASFLHHLPEELLAAAKKMPGAGIVIEAVRAWWHQHPLRPAGAMAEQAARNIVVPMAQRNPIAFVGSALVIGALMVASRPWRWLLRPALFVGIVPQLVAQVMKRYPAESLVRMATGLMQKRASPPRPAKHMPPAASPTPPL